MSTYAIGDIHGCYTTLLRLLDRIELDRERDRLWLVGDLVNRGLHSLEVLRWARGFGPGLTVVLGNHDLHFLARAFGVRAPRPRDTLDELLDATDRDELLDWLSRRPLLHRDGDYAMVHAGLLPAWSLERAEALADEVEGALRSPSLIDLLAAYSDDEVGTWSNRLTGITRLERVAGCLTRLRICDADGQPHPRFNLAPEHAPPGCSAWFDARPLSESEPTIIFGHWASLGLAVRPKLLGLDTGCVWGGALTAVRLDDGVVFQEPCAEGDTNDLMRVLTS